TVMSTRKAPSGRRVPSTTLSIADIVVRARKPSGRPSGVSTLRLVLPSGMLLPLRVSRMDSVWVVVTVCPSRWRSTCRLPILRPPSSTLIQVSSLVIGLVAGLLAGLLAALAAGACARVVATNEQARHSASRNKAFGRPMGWLRGDGCGQWKPRRGRGQCAAQQNLAPTRQPRRYAYNALPPNDGARP